MVTYTEADLRKAWLSFLFTLYDLEKEGLDMGEWPDIETFREFFEQELEAYFATYH